MIHYIFSMMGFVISKSGMVYTKNRFSRFIANLAVHEGSFKKIKPNLYTLNQ